MLVLRCDETTVHATVAAVCGFFFLFALLRATVRILVSLATRIKHRFMNPVLDELLWSTATVVALVVFASSSALLPALMLLATVTSAAFCRSFLSFRWLWVSSLTFYCLALFNVIAPLLVEDVDVAKQEWSPLVRRQHVLMPSLRTIVAASSRVVSEAGRDQFPPRYIYSFYDSVKIEGSASPLAASAVPTPKLSVDIVSWLRATWKTDKKNVFRMNQSGLNREPEKGEMNTLLTFYIVASGDETMLTHYAEVLNDENAHMPFADFIFLGGKRSRIQHSQIHCHPYMQSASSSAGPSDLPRAHMPCLRLHVTTLLRNVTIYWTERPEVDALASDATSSKLQVFYAGQEAEENCTAVQDAIAMQIGNGRREVEGVEEYSSTATHAAARLLLDCIEELSISELPDSFVQKAPFPVRFGWYFPRYMCRVQEALLLLTDHVILPLGFLFADGLNVCCSTLSAVLVRFGVWFVAAMPHIKHAAEEVVVYTGGLLCGGNAAPIHATFTGATSGTTPSSSLLTSSSLEDAFEAQAAVSRAHVPVVRLCAAFGRTHASHVAFKAGAQTRMSALAVLSTLADAADLFPGVWNVFRWAWDAEATVTRGILYGLWTVGHFLLFVLPRPLLRVFGTVAHTIGMILLRLDTPLCAVWRVLAQLPLLSSAFRLFTWWWGLEAHWLRYEWSVFRKLAGIIITRAEVLLTLVLRVVPIFLHKASCFMAQYSGTSFSIHLVVTVVQSLLLLVAMRNEMRELIEAESQRTSSPHSPLHLFKRVFPRRVEHYLPLESLTARANGLFLLLRAHHQACMNYLLLHSIGLLVLIGLSVLPFTSKLYSLTLRYVLPWLSTKAFLVFFDDESNRQATAVVVVVRMALSTALQQTIGDLLYRIVKDCLIALGLFGGLTLTLWVWPRRVALAKQVVTAIADSLHNTPVPTPQRTNIVAASEKNERAKSMGESNVASQHSIAGSVAKSQREGHNSNVSAEGEREDTVAKRIDLSDAT